MTDWLTNMWLTEEGGVYINSYAILLISIPFTLYTKRPRSMGDPDPDKMTNFRYVENVIVPLIKFVLTMSNPFAEMILY